MVVAIAAAGCSSLLGLSDYHETAGPVSDGGPLGDGSAGSCADVDLTQTCYACTPQTNAQFLNSCSSSDCVPFDDKTRVTMLLPDGGLPPVPKSDGGP